MLKQSKNLDINNTEEAVFERIANSPFVLSKVEKAKAIMSKIKVPTETLVEKIAKNAHITSDQAANALDAVIASVQSSLKEDGKVVLPGLGVFSLSTTSTRSGRNLRTGKEIKIKAKKVAKFEASDEFLARVNK